MVLAYCSYSLKPESASQGTIACGKSAVSGTLDYLHLSLVTFYAPFPSFLFFLSPLFLLPYLTTSAPLISHLAVFLIFLHDCPVYENCGNVSFVTTSICCIILIR